MIRHLAMETPKLSYELSALKSQVFCGEIVLKPETS
jgi:hypothetical protein